MQNLFRKFHEKDIELMEKISITPFYSGFWNRFRIDKAIRQVAPRAHGVLLDVGCGIKPYQKAFQPYVKHYIGLEYSPKTVYRGHKADIFGDAMNLPFADASIDTILCTEVLEHLPRPWEAIAEFYRVLRPNGILIITAPFFFPIHDKLDFFRYTPKGISSLMKQNGLEVEEIKPLSGTGVTLALLFNLYWFEIGFMWTKWLYPFGIVLRPILLLFCLIVNVFGWVLEKVLPSEHMSFNHLTVAKKNTK
ncbi:MAG: methyltransferase domain-containing protein [Deltaproteobacteria bacterium]|nr:methyltransferase domain-containing protein [Deltaproteobacteria bacterium]